MIHNRVSHEIDCTRKLFKLKSHDATKHSHDREALFPTSHALRTFASLRFLESFVLADDVEIGFWANRVKFKVGRNKKLKLV